MSVLSTPEMGAGEFAAIRRLVYDIAGINLHAGKEGLVRTRLGKRLRELGIADFRDYVRLLESEADGKEVAWMVDLLTTNKTSFFREAQHFEFLQRELVPQLTDVRRPVRIWCAGCSSGEEPYSLAMMLRESLPAIDERDVKILATDLSVRVLARAHAGVYPEAVVAEVPPQLRSRYFSRVAGGYRVGESVRGMVRFARLNLMASWPMRGPFDVVFCRNVMIYFDRETQERLVNRFWELLTPGGYLLVGHSESLTALAHRFRYLQPAVYAR